MSSDKTSSSQAANLNDKDLLVAITAILMAIARADGKVEHAETEEILQNLITHNKRGYRLQDLREIMAIAEDLSKEKELVRQSVNMVASYLSQEQRNELLLVTKSIAYADGIITQDERKKIVALAKVLM